MFSWSKCSNALLDRGVNTTIDIGVIANRRYIQHRPTMVIVLLVQRWRLFFRCSRTGARRRVIDNRVHTERIVIVGILPSAMGLTYYCQRARPRFHRHRPLGYNFRHFIFLRTPSQRGPMALHQTINSFTGRGLTTAILSGGVRESGQYKTRCHNGIFLAWGRRCPQGQS